MRRFLAAFVASLLGLTTPFFAVSASATESDNGCTSFEQTSKTYTDDRGIEIAGGRCIPGTQVPSDAEYTYEYQPICHGQVPDDCAPLVCDEAEAPARIFSVTRTHLTTGQTEFLGGGC